MIQTYSMNTGGVLKKQCQSPPSTPANRVSTTSTLQYDGSHYSPSEFPSSPSGIKQV